jgi:DNA polymerase III delta subunit
LIYLIHGPERLLAREAAHAVASEIDPEGINTIWLDARETPLERMITAIGSASFFGAPRVVVVSDLLARSPRDSDGADADEGSVERRARGLPHLDPLFAAVPTDHRLILFEPSLSAAPAAFKAAVPAATIIASEPPRGAALLAWIDSAAQRAGSTIDRRTAQLLAETLFPQTWDRKPANPRYDRPPDLSLLTQEIEKLALSAHPAPIAAAHVTALVPGGPDQRLFRFVDAAIGGDLAAATLELDRLIAAGEEPAMLLAQVLGQIELAAVAATAGDRDAASVARALGAVNPGRMSAVMSSTRGRRGSLALAAITTASAIDRGLKTGRIRQPRDALQDLLAALAQHGHHAQTGRSQ